MALRFRGSAHFRLRLACATLSGRTIRIDDIRARDENPGLRDYEASLLRLLEKVTNGCVVEINETGTTLRYKPGIVTGGPGLVHDCGTSRAIGWFLEPLAVIALFGKKPLVISLRGITNDDVDPSVDAWRAVTLPLLRQVTGAEGGFDLKISRRGAPPLVPPEFDPHVARNIWPCVDHLMIGGGEVTVKIPVIKELPPVCLTDEGLVKRIRGVAHSMKVSPQTSNRMVDGARGVLNALLADVFVFTDHMSGGEAGASPGYGVMLVAETTSARLLSAECSVARETMGEEVSVPEEVGRRAAHTLLEEVHRGGVVDSTHQGILLLLCALGPEEVHEVRLGLLTDYAVATLRHVKDFFDVTFAIRPEKESRTIFLSCVGAGIRNAAKKVT